MEKLIETNYQGSKRPISSNHGTCLVQIYPVGSTMGQRHNVDKSPLILGRGEDCQIQILDSSVSRRHARIEPMVDGHYILDLNSTNGTYVNEVQSVDNCPILLKDGDNIRLGNCLLRFLTEGNPEIDYHEELYRLTIIDALTQTYNQRHFVEFLEREAMRSNRHGRALSLVMLDIDRFKSINDTLGHLGGDFTLRELARIIRNAVRREDLFARYGGEEFGLVLVETNRERAIEAAERLRVIVEKHTFRFEEHTFHITISLGAAEYIPQAGINDLIRRADENLYTAKRTGRNRVVG